MLKPADDFFLQQEEPVKSCLLALRKIILSHHTSIEESWKYSMPFYNYNAKRFCYLWVHKKFRQPYLGIVDGNKIEHPLLIQEKRSRMKIMLIDPEKDIPLKEVEGILEKGIQLCTSTK